MSDLKGPESREGAFRLRRNGIHSAHGNWLILGPERVDIHPSVQNVVVFVCLRVTGELCIVEIATFSRRRYKENLSPLDLRRREVVVLVSKC